MNEGEPGKPDEPSKEYLDAIGREFQEMVEEHDNQILEPKLRQTYLDYRYETPGSHFAEVRGMVKEDDLSDLLGEVVKNPLKNNFDAFDYLEYVVALKELDPKWFESHYKENSDILLILTRFIDSFENSPLLLLKYLNNFKTFNIDYYNQAIKPSMDNNVWKKIATAIREAKYGWDKFVIDYARAAYLDYEEISKRIELGNDWLNITTKLKELERVGSSVSYAEAVAASQSVRPNNETRVIFRKSEWNIFKAGLSGTITKYRKEKNMVILQNFAETARTIKYLEVEE